MKIIKKIKDYIYNTIGLQNVENDIEYVKSQYVIEDGNAIYNTITGEAILIEDLEKDKNYLISHWFFVPKDMDICSISHLIRQKRLFASKNSLKYNKKNLYVIFTTTACNAACSYCFEKDYDIYTMSEKTALDVANYIEKTADKTKPITLKWFGGEPLCNKKVINIICEHLNNKGINFLSIMTSNGSLLDECTDKEIKNVWKLKKIQLTFDDIDGEYDKIKNLPTGSFDRLVTNMFRLKQLGVIIELRIHYNPLKGKQTCIKIANKFKNFSNVRMYAALVYDSMSEKYFKELLEIEDYLHNINHKGYYFLNPDSIIHCMADSPKMIGITPDGGLTPCEHFAYGKNIFGTIYKKEIDENILQTWSARYKFTDKKCKICPLYPSCNKLIMCPAEGKCSEGYQYYQIEKIKRALKKGCQILQEKKKI